MNVCHFLDVPEITGLKGAKGVSKRTLIGQVQCAPNFYLRRFHVEPHGNTPLHSHPWEHEIYVLSGTGTVSVAGEEAVLREGVCVFIPSDVEHQILSGDKPLEFIYIVPVIE
ncbi:cupin domain-containing protein [archaeon]|nr:cupin domain-containing protein [archaeon]